MPFLEGKMMADAKKSCYCPAVLAIVIAVLTILRMLRTIDGRWVNIVVFIAAILIAIGSFAGDCLCTKFCKTEQKQA